MKIKLVPPIYFHITYKSKDQTHKLCDYNFIITEAIKISCAHSVTFNNICTYISGKTTTSERISKIIQPSISYFLFKSERATLFIL